MTAQTGTNTAGSRSQRHSTAVDCARENISTGSRNAISASVPEVSSIQIFAAGLLLLLAAGLRYVAAHPGVGDSSTAGCSLPSAAATAPDSAAFW